MVQLNRGERLQIMLTESELAILDNFRFKNRMPSRAAAVRELLKRGLTSDGSQLSTAGRKSKDFGLLAMPSLAAAKRPGKGKRNL